MGWDGEALIEPGRLVYRGRLGPAHMHAHAALQIAVVDSGTVSLSDSAHRTRETALAVIPSGQPHAISTGVASGLMLYLEPTSSHAQRIAATLPAALGDNVSHWSGAFSAVSLPSVDADLSAAADRIVAELLGPQANDIAASIHPSVTRAITVIDSTLTGKVSLTEVARCSHLSADRLGRLFRRHTGMSFPAFVRWARLRRAMVIAREGSTITDAAHAAGFSDGAHANRVFHEMFGVGPSDLLHSITIL